MREFQEPSLPEQIARDRYLLDKPQQAMERLLEDAHELASLVKDHSLENFNIQPFESLLSIIDAGLNGLLKLAFNPEENRFFVSKFRPSLRKIIMLFIHDAPPQFFNQLNHIATHYAYLSRTKVKKPSIGVKKYIVGVATAVVGALGASVFAPVPKPNIPKPDTYVSSDIPSSEPEMIEVGLPDASSQMVPQDSDSALESPYYASSLEKTKQQDKEEIERKEQATLNFKQQIREALEKGMLHYSRYFIDREKIVGNALPHNVASAEKNLRRMVDELRPKIKDLSVERYFQIIAPYITSPTTKNDSRNHRSYLTDLLNDVAQLSGRKHTSYTGNCEARTSAYLALTQELRPDLLKQSFVQVFKDHVRFGMSDSDTLYGVDGGVKKLDRTHLRGSALATPEDFFVQPFLTGKPYQPPETSKDLKYMRDAHTHSDSLLPGVNGKGLKTFDQEKEEELIATGVEPPIAEKMIQKMKIEGGCNLPNGGGYCVSMRAEDYQTEAAFIHSLERDSDHVFQLNLKDFPLTPRLVQAISKLHYLHTLKINETGLIPEVPSPMLALTDDPTNADYILKPGDLLPDLLRKVSSIETLRLPKLKYASRFLLRSVKNLPHLKDLLVPTLLKDAFTQVVSPDIVRGDHESLIASFDTDYYSLLQTFKDHHISTKDAPSQQHIHHWLTSLSPETMEAIKDFSKPTFVLIPPRPLRSLSKAVPHAFFWPEGWKHVDDASGWRFGITDAIADMPFDPTIYYKHSETQTDPRTRLEMIREYARRYREQGLTLMPQEAYVPLHMTHNGGNIDQGAITFFEPGEYSPKYDFVPYAYWGGFQVNLSGAKAASSDDGLRCRPWIGGKGLESDPSWFSWPSRKK